MRIHRLWIGPHGSPKRLQRVFGLIELHVHDPEIDVDSGTVRAKVPRRFEFPRGLGETTPRGQHRAEVLVHSGIFRIRPHRSLEHFLSVNQVPSGKPERAQQRQCLAVIRMALQGPSQERLGLPRLAARDQ